MIIENVYGHAKRLKWILSHLQMSDSICEIGCGTGYMITLQLAIAGYHVLGMDSDENSILFGNKLFERFGLSSNLMTASKFSEIKEMFDVIIISEVLEHLSKNEIDDLFFTIKNRLKPNGKLLITVPFGYGWFEFESALWFKFKVGFLLEKLRIT